MNTLTTEKKEQMIKDYTKFLSEAEIKADQINEWITQRTSGTCLYGDNTVIVTIMNNGGDSLSHVGKDGKLEITQFVDGFLTGVHIYAPDFAEDKAKPFTQNKLDEIADRENTEAELRFTVETMNVLDFQKQQLESTTGMIEMYKQILDGLEKEV